MRVLLLGAAAAAAWIGSPLVRAARQDPPPAEARPAPQSDGPFFRGNSGQARAWARIKNKTAVFAFYARDCEPCRKFDAETLADAQVRALLAEHTVPVRLEDERDSFGAFWCVRERPTFVFVTPDGEELGRIAGTPAPERFLEEARSILSELDGLASARARVEKDGEDAWAHVLLARALRNRGKDADALAEFLWVLDRTRGREEWRPQREGEVLREINVLSQRASAATFALRERREAQAALLLEPPPEGEDPPSDAELCLAARDVRLLSSTLNDSARTLAVWDELRDREGTPRARIDELFSAELAAQLLQSKRYADLLWAWPDLLVVVEQRMAEVQALRSDGGEGAREMDPATLELNRLLGEASGYYEALLGVGREKDASDLADLLLAFEPNVRAYTSLMIGAQRAERLDRAREIYERGLAALEAPAQKQALQRVGEGVLGRRP
jgi:hypothetical protein